MRPAFSPTDEQREAVRSAVAEGLRQPEIAARIGVAAPTLRKYFAEELGTTRRERATTSAPPSLFDAGAAATPAGPAPSEQGRPPYRPLQSDRDKVELWAATNMTQREMARALGVSEPTLRAAFADELENGAARKRAEAIVMLHRAARAGNVAAIKELAARIDEADLARLGGMPAAPKAPSPKEDTPGKKARALEDAHEVATSGSWATLLQ